jgi:hypothetical protein
MRFKVNKKQASDMKTTNIASLSLRTNGGTISSTYENLKRTHTLDTESSKQERTERERERERWRKSKRKS